MSKVLVTESYLTAIGDAIRNKNGSTTKYKPSEMARAINGITTQGGQDNTVLNSILNRTIVGNYANDDLTGIGAYAFFGCIYLISATFAKATKIDTGAFSSCMSLESISLPEVKEINASAFTSCRLKSISMPKIEVLGHDNEWWGIFDDYCEITTINIPSTIKSIGKHAFDSSNITTINIARRVGSISGAPWGANATVNWTGTT